MGADDQNRACSACSVVSRGRATGSRDQYAMQLRRSTRRGRHHDSGGQLSVFSSSSPSSSSSSLSSSSSSSSYCPLPASSKASISAASSGTHAGCTSEYRLDFGRYKGRTLEECEAANMAWLLRGRRRLTASRFLGFRDALATFARHGQSRRTSTPTRVHARDTAPALLPSPAPSCAPSERPRSLERSQLPDDLVHLDPNNNDRNMEAGHQEATSTDGI
jgi:hypothetical protein